MKGSRRILPRLRTCDSPSTRFHRRTPRGEPAKCDASSSRKCRSFQPGQPLGRTKFKLFVRLGLSLAPAAASTTPSRADWASGDGAHFGERKLYPRQRTCAPSSGRHAPPRGGFHCLLRRGHCRVSTRPACRSRPCWPNTAGAIAFAQPVKLLVAGDVDRLVQPSRLPGQPSALDRVEDDPVGFDPQDRASADGVGPMTPLHRAAVHDQDGRISPPRDCPSGRESSRLSRGLS